MRLPVKISVSASLISILSVYFIFNNMQTQLLLSKKTKQIEKYQLSIEGIKYTTDLVIDKARNILSVISILDTSNNNLNLTIQKRLEYYVKTSPEINELKYITLDGKLVAGASKTKLKIKDSKSYENEYLFKKGLENNIFIDRIYFSKQNKEMMINISTKVMDLKNYKPIGIIIAKISMQQLQEIISDSLVEFDSIALLDVSVNKFLYKSSEAKNIEDKFLLTSAEGVSSLAYKNSNYIIVSSKYVNNFLDIKYYMIIDEAKLLKSINSTFNNNLILLLSIILLSSIMIYFIVLLALKPLKKLTKSIYILSKEIDSEFKNKLDTKLDEVSEIKFYFERFVKLIKNDRKMLEEFNMNLQQKVEHEVRQNIKKDEQLIQQSRLAQMGEMISMIAHQWRQPLGAISSTAIDLNMQIEFENFDLEKERGRKECQSYFTNGLGEIDGFVQNLTNTIDDFRNFYQPNKESSSVYFIEPISKALNIIKASFLSDGIEIVQTCVTCDKKVKIHSNELMQVILNILKNSQDNFKEQGTKNPKIIITCKCSIEDEIILEICDNGGGIPDDVLPNIFNPYFSTKDEKNGTGLGLYMSKTIIEDHHHGKLYVKNTDNGVCFTIKIETLS